MSRKINGQWTYAIKGCYYETKLVVQIFVLEKNAFGFDLSASNLNFVLSCFVNEDASLLLKGYYDQHL
jgi:hypothetical protein